jgi:hypothetical protein
MSDTLQLVVDDQLRNKLDESKHVNSLCEGSDDERIPSSMGLVHYYSSVSDSPEIQRGGEKDVQEYPVYPARRGIAP